MFPEVKRKTFQLPSLEHQISYDPRSYEVATFAIVEAWKIQDFKGVWTRDLRILVRRSNQLSYEATDSQS